MKRIKIIGILVTGVIVLIVAIFVTVGYFKPKSAGLLIDTEPASTVYINGEHKGRTKYDTTISSGEVLVRLVPDSYDRPLAPFETKVNLQPGIKTIIQRSFAESEEASSGAIISFEKGSASEVGLSVVSFPDAVQVSVDGQVRGFTPFRTSAITAGEHVVSVTAPGYKEKTINLKAYEGYNLTAFFKLSPEDESESGETPKEVLPPTPSPTEKPEENLVLILETPTGFLRVRKEPSTLADEVGQVKPGEEYEILDEDEKTGWFEIEYEEGKTGWISSQYTEKNDVSPSPTPTPKEE